MPKKKPVHSSKKKPPSKKRFKKARAIADAKRAPRTADAKPKTPKTVRVTKKPSPAVAALQALDLRQLRDEWDAVHAVLDKAGVTQGGTVLDRVGRLSEREVLGFNKLIDTRAQIGALKAAHTIAIERAIGHVQDMEQPLAEIKRHLVASSATSRDVETLEIVEQLVMATLNSLAPPVEPVFDAKRPLDGPLPEGGVDEVVPPLTEVVPVVTAAEAAEVP